MFDYSHDTAPVLSPTQVTIVACRGSMAYYRDTFSSMFIAALFRIVRSWEEPRCLSTDEWIMKVLYSYVMEYYETVKTNEFTDK